MGQGAGVRDDLGGVDAELRPERFTEGYGLRRDDVHQRPALHAGEYRLVDLLRPALLTEDEAAPRAA